MKVKILLFSLLIIISCKKTEHQNLIGTWILIEGETLDYQTKYDKVTFKENDSFVLEYPVENDMIIKVTGKYHFVQKKMITMKYENYNLKLVLMR